jgi:hypothetical protein
LKHYPHFPIDKGSIDKACSGMEEYVGIDCGLTTVGGLPGSPMRAGRINRWTIIERIRGGKSI